MPQGSLLGMFQSLVFKLSVVVSWLFCNRVLWDETVLLCAPILALITDRLGETEATLLGEARFPTSSPVTARGYNTTL